MFNADRLTVMGLLEFDLLIGRSDTPKTSTRKICHTVFFIQSIRGEFGMIFINQARKFFRLEKTAATKTQYHLKFPFIIIHPCDIIPSRIIGN